MARKSSFKYLLFNAEQLAEMIDARKLYSSVYFTDEDLSDWEPSDGEHNCIYSIYKGELYNEDYGVLIIGCVCGGMTVAKDITLLADREPYNRQKRTDGMTKFIQEWLEEMLETDKVWVQIEM